MKQLQRAFGILIILIITPAPWVTAENHHSGSIAQGSGAHGRHQGETIHTSTVQGYQFIYRLIDLREHVQHMPGQKITHHLMVYISTPDGAPVEDARVGYLVVGADKVKQKLMTMGMQGGFGADVNFQAPGTYSVKTKAVVGDKKLMDRFTYQVQ